MRNSGSVIGGAINFSTNHTQAKSGGIAWSTYIIFLIFGEWSQSALPCVVQELTSLSECTGVIWGLLLSRTKKVRRRDGSRVPYSGDMTWKNEFIALGKHLQNKRVRSFTDIPTRRYRHTTGDLHLAPLVDLAYFHPRLLFILLRRCLRNIPLPSFLCQSASHVVSHCP